MRIPQKLAVLAALAGFAGAAASARAGDILFIGNDGTTPGVFSPTDMAMVSRLTTVLGHTVTMLDDNNTTAPMVAMSNQLVLISNSSSSGAIANVWGTVPGTDNDASHLRSYGCNVLAFEAGNGVTINLGFVGSTTAGNGTFPAANLNILMPAHPLAAGLSGASVPVVTAAANFSSFGTESGVTLGRTIVPSADVVATYFTAALGGHNLGAIVALEQGDALGNPASDPDFVATAPSRRVGFFLESTTFDVLNADGLALFDAAVNYAISGPCVPEPSAWLLGALGFIGLLVQRRVAGKR